ncbi:alpha/beta fold hydrolase [Thetidibacter halocola]|uniref:Alpha/beta fold hydrolase n=1 Tax=Thetidibacter halocola TaxID=2827239 RepID=A0A8J7WD95_9RHOB|nr:alpha/beta hydrolase [Thetidibacter halocola]MBS0124319.1 alpha/beta fold hydrolase [Thetidibacter halocola]
MTEQQFATAQDGTRIAYRVWGDPEAAQRVALVHALAMTADFWAETAAHLVPDCAVLAIDCRGHGASDKPAGPYTAGLFAQDLASVLDALGWDRAIVGGASMGGCVALAFAQQFPERTAGLALIDTTAWYGEGADAAWEDRGQKAKVSGLASLVDFQKTRWFGDAFRQQNPDKVELPVGIFLNNDVDAYLETCRMLGRCDLRAGLGALATPVEIMVGEEDYATPVAMAQALQAAIPQSRLTELPGARHFTPLEVPDKVADTIRRVVARL